MIVVLATSNPHKREEVAPILARALPDVTVWGAGQVGGMPPVEENGATFEANARLKALALHTVVRQRGHDEGDWFLADDSGLVVPALDGAPGLHSARYAGPEATDARNRAKLIDELRRLGVGEAPAAFVCWIVLVRNGRAVESFEGRCEGVVKTVPAGEGGFGYDPLFVPDGYRQTFSQLRAGTKNQISHRAEALARMARWLRDVDDL